MKSKNLFPVAIGALLALGNVLLLANIVQYFFASAGNLKTLNFDLMLYYFYTEFAFAAGTSSFWAVLTYISPLLYVIFVLEIANYFLRRSSLGKFRFGVIFFVLVNIGYLLAKIFYGSLSLVMFNQENKFVEMTQFLGFGQPGRILTAFLLIVILVGYLNYSTIKLNKYISQ